MKLRKIISFAIVLCLFGSTFTHAESTGWGLSFQEDGQPPVGNAGAEDLLQYNAWYIGDTAQKTIYLTFDAGYENGYTAAILDVLKEKDVPAAFFLVGTYIEANPELVKRMADEGHIVANHTATHPDMSAISDLDAFQRELTQTEELYRAATGKEMPKYYRPPRGVFSTENLKMAHDLGYKTIFWSLAYVDWYRDDQPTQEEAFSKLLPRVHPGAILLLHSTSQTNAEILGQLIDQYRSMGYTFGSLEEL
ncbi:MAG: delta-lactam-biosynthetic de-N-acetylase [Oscillospiraceae bacterium]|nr:delta-lactam-biosynthetic de-N-acetylase [Oscillospiraceae bacterium]